jgi:hypothetical protein
MQTGRRHLVSVFRIISTGIILLSGIAQTVQASDSIEDPVRQPHLKAWSNVIPNASKRFVVLDDFMNQAVLDRETGLVWERAPASSPLSWLGQNGARGYCAEKNVGGRKGWRLPAIIELSSLIDPAVQAPGPTLPAGHPFTGIQSSFYWSTSTFVDLPDNAWGVNFHNGTVTPGVKVGAVPVWCVRGPMNADVY